MTKNVGFLLPDFENDEIISAGETPYSPAVTAEELASTEDAGFWIEVNDDEERVLCTQIDETESSLSITLAGDVLVTSLDFVGGRPPRRPH